MAYTVPLAQSESLEEQSHGADLRDAIVQSDSHKKFDDNTNGISTGWWMGFWEPATPCGAEWRIVSFSTVLSRTSWERLRGVNCCIRLIEACNSWLRRAFERWLGQHSKLSIGQAGQRRRICAEILARPPQPLLALLLARAEPILPKHRAHVLWRRTGKRIACKQPEHVAVVI